MSLLRKADQTTYRNPADCGTKQVYYEGESTASAGRSQDPDRSNKSRDEPGENITTEGEDCQTREPLPA